MRGPQKTRDSSGQALVELAVVLPVLVLFMMMVLPLSLRGVLLPWLDERLYLGLMSPPDGTATHSRLQTAHEPDALPHYFQEKAIEERRTETTLGPSLPQVGTFFPGQVAEITSSVAPQWSKGWDHAALGKAPDEDRKLSRSMSVVSLTSPCEDQVPQKVRRLALVGLAGRAVQVLSKAGFNTFHLDLDALPKTVLTRKEGEEQP